MEEPPPATEPAPEPRRLTVADLLRLRRPTTGASSLPSSPAPAAAAPRPRKKPKLAAASNPTTKPSTAPFAPLSDAVLLSGTLSLPSAASPAACRSHCLAFSDPSPSPASPAASVCCYLLDFHPAALGREIRVLAWNYLPSLRLHGAPGVLEVVRWCLAEEEPAPAPESSFLAMVPLGCAARETSLTISGCVFGLVTSVSVVFSMPRVKAQGSGSSVGFLAEMLCCGCRRCRVSPPEAEQGHKFEVVKFVYFVESASTWRPVLARFIGKPVYVSGLKKTLVSVGDKGSYTMLVPSTKTAVAWCPSYKGNMLLDGSPEKCGRGYAGVITGIYMQGLVVELDDTVWVLVDDQTLPPPHSLRVGALISVKNFRAIPLLIYIKADSKSHLGNFVDSLEMPARFWMLLLISCFKKKFAKSFSEVEILGSQNVPTESRIGSNLCYESSIFNVPTSVHNCGSSSLGPNLEACKLVIPFSNFICNGESLWISTMLKFWNAAEEAGKNQGRKPLLCNGASYPGSTRRVIPSEDLGFVLVGSIKASSLSGRLQLVDSTGSIDVVIPDLPQNENLYGVYEISDYKLVLEGPVAYLDHRDAADALSCKAVFQHLFYRKRMPHLRIYVIVCWSKLSHVGPPSHIPLHINYRARLFHLVKLCHIFPANSNIHCQNALDPVLYAEAVILPYDLKFIGQGECEEHAESFILSRSSLPDNSEVSMSKLCYIPCSLSFGSMNLHGTLVSRCSCGPDGTVVSKTFCCGREHMQRILLEFKERSFFKYQLLRIGGFYLLQCPSGNLSSTMEVCECLKGGKVSIDSLDKIWSLAITFNGNRRIKGTTGNQFITVPSVKMDEPFSGHATHDEIKLVQPWDDFFRLCYFRLDFPCEEISKEMEEHNTIYHILNGLCVYFNEVLTVSSCIDIMMPKEASGSANMQNEEVTQGGFISLQGKVENIHSHVCKDVIYLPGNDKSSICIHVADDNHKLRICGDISKHSSLVGMGPGSTVIFHRILLTKRHELLLTPVTYIEVTSISRADPIEESVSSQDKSNYLKDGSMSTSSPCLFVEQKHFTDSRSMQFNCRVATVLMLVLENCPDVETAESTKHGKMPKVKVSRACFILDDGSSLHCCWADDTRAELLLRLQEVAPLDAAVNLKLSKDGSSKKSQCTIGSCLEKMLKKHTGVVAKDCGIPPDFSCRDLDLSSALGKVISCLEEKLLKFIILNACCKGTLNVIASIMNPNSLNGFNLELPNSCPLRHMQMFWINEVIEVDPLEEARRLYGNLKGG
ncbi:hypothetical protein ACP4OV_024098 [Aristida adscensionis]